MKNGSRTDKIIKTLVEKLNQDDRNDGDLLFLLKALVLKFLDNNDQIDFLKNQDLLRASFSFDTLFEIWQQKPLGGIFYPEECKKIDDRSWQGLLAFVKDFPLLKGENTDIIGRIYERQLLVCQRKNQGVFYTPRNIADFMITELTQLNDEKMKDFKILDPACGSGMLLSASYDYLSGRFGQDLTKKRRRHQKLLEKTLIGVDRDVIACLVTKLVLILKGDSFVFPLGIYQSDILLKDQIEKGSIDVIIANPPYVGHKEIDKNYRQELKQKYAPVYLDKADLSYCFVYRSWELLKNNGHFIYITSRYFLEAHFAGALRQFISDHFEILKLIDFNGNRIIKGIGVDPAILSLKKTTAIAKNHQILIKRFKIPGDHDKKTEELVNELFLKESPSYESFFVDQAPLKEGSWRLYKPITRSIIEKIEKKAPFFLSQLGESFQGMITGNDKAFIFKQVPFELKDPAALKPWLKNKDVLVNRIAKPSQWLVYTDGIKDMEAETGLLTYLSMHRKKLEKRRECRLGKRPWYFLQWGRALKRFESKKIVFPYKASINRFAVDVGGSCFSADIYGMLLNEQCCYTEETLVLLLNSRLYNYYFKSYAKKLGNNLYEYYPNTVLRLKIPVFNAKQLSVIKDYYDILKVNSNNELRKKDENQFNDFLYHYFELNKDERDEIEKVRVGCRKIFST